MSINSFTNSLNKNSSFLQTNTNTSIQDAQAIERIAKSLEASALKFESEKSRKRKIQSTTIETLEEPTKRVRIDNTTNNGVSRNILPSFCYLNKSTFSENSFHQNDIFSDQPLAGYNYSLESTTSDELKNHKGFVLTCVKTCGGKLEFASKNLQNDKQVVLAAVQNSGSALRFASDTLKDDPEVVFTAVKEYSFPLLFASSRLKNDKNFLMKCITLSEFIIQFAGEILLDDEEVILSAINLYGDYPLVFASQRLKNDKNFLFECLKLSKSCLRFASHKLQNDPQLLLEAKKF